MGSFAEILDPMVALVRVGVVVALRLVAGVLRFTGRYPRFAVAVVGLWYVAEVAQ